MNQLNNYKCDGCGKVAQEGDIFTIPITHKMPVLAQLLIGKHYCNNCLVKLLKGETPKPQEDSKPLEQTANGSNNKEERN